MSDFEPGPGWREVEYGTETKNGGWIMQSVPRGQDRYWVREAPVPPLPTAPYTVIEVDAGGDEDGPWFLGGDLWWQVGSNLELTPGVLLERITGWELRSEPRAVTAEAVLERLSGGLSGQAVESIKREFGVEP